jgi:N-acetyl sugar amidotransferase
MNKNNSLFGMPEIVIFCEKCVISNQRPSSTIEFKSKNTNKKTGISILDNVCSACLYLEEKKKINWKKREELLIQLLNKHRKKSGYDVIVPGSGGKDSAYTAHILKYKYGMNPLTVTWAAHLYTDIGFKNLQNWSHVGGLDNLLFTPNGKLHRLITKYAFLNLLHPFQPFIIGQRLIGPKIAERFNIPLVMYGENQAEYGNSIKENYIPKMDYSFFSNSNVNQIYLGGQNIKKIMKNEKFKINDFEPYIPPKIKDLKKKNIEVHYLGFYHKWDPQECYYYASQNTGFMPNEERTEGSYSKYSSIDDKIDVFHYYTTYIKYGLGRASYDAAQEIRNDKITRDEGVKLINKFDHEFPKKYFHDFLNYISISEVNFWKIIDKFRSPHLWLKKNKKWELRKKII